MHRDQRDVGEQHALGTEAVDHRADASATTAPVRPMMATSATNAAW